MLIFSVINLMFRLGNQSLLSNGQNCQLHSKIQPNPRDNGPREAKNQALLEEYYKLVASEGGNSQTNPTLVNDIPVEEEKKSIKQRKKAVIKIISEETYIPESNSVYITQGR